MARPRACGTPVWGYGTVPGKMERRLRAPTRTRRCPARGTTLHPPAPFATVAPHHLAAGAQLARGVGLYHDWACALGTLACTPTLGASYGVKGQCAPSCASWNAYLHTTLGTTPPSPRPGAAAPRAMSWSPLAQIAVRSNSPWRFPVARRFRNRPSPSGHVSSFLSVLCSTAHLEPYRVEGSWSPSIFGTAFLTSPLARGQRLSAVQKRPARIASPSHLSQWRPRRGWCQKRPLRSHHASRLHPRPS